MSENPNPTRCGNCGTVNPPGQEFCIKCHAPLTLVADGDALAGTPEAPDELRHLENPDVDEPPEMTSLGSASGGLIPTPTEPGPPEENRSS